MGIGEAFVAGVGATVLMLIAVGMLLDGAG